MATRPRTSTFPGQPSLRPVYEDFQPKIEIKENQEAHVFHIHLPGFTREQIRITYKNFIRMVNISGERQIDRYRWNRFNQSYPVPLICEAEKLQATFDQGTLTVIMPKKLVSQVAPKMEEKTQEKDAFPLKKSVAEEPKGLKALITPEPIRESKPQKGQEEIEPKPKLITPRKRTDEKPPRGPSEIEEKPIFKKAPIKATDEQLEEGHEEIKQKTKLSAIPRKRTDEKAVVTRAEDAERKKEIKKEVKEAADAKPSESRKIQKNEKGMFKEKEIRTRKVTPKTPQTTSKAAPAIADEGEGKEDMIDSIGKGIKQVSTSTSQIVKRIAEVKWNDEDQRALVNMGAALLVMAALGAYVSYRFASSGRS